MTKMFFDYSPYTKGSVGFDRMFNLLENVGSIPNYPPYNIIQKDDDSYIITVAVAGFTEAEINITTHRNELIINGRTEDSGEEINYLHKGIAARDFEQRFQMADYVVVDSAKMENGLLVINLVRNLPEEVKPKTIKIG